ncbi:hypothetical protein K501DRAFT_324464 [Backusella circina FSU 941]|nr:hypothetical protein K501DRAFT_324464 [Backusella circina FSU 941]
MSSTAIPGERFIRTLRHYLEANEHKLTTQSTLHIPQQPTIIEEEKEEPNGLIKAVSSLWSGASSSRNSIATTSNSDVTSLNSRPSSLYGLPIPYMSLLAAASPNASSLSNIPYMPIHSTFTLDVHYLYFLLVQFEYLGLEQTQLPVPENGLVETETTLTAGQAPSIVSSVGSVMSNMSLTTGWQFWNKQERNNNTQAGRPLHEDILFIHRYLSRVSALKLHMNLLVDTQKGVTRSGQRMIRGYETPIPHDLVLTLSPFKQLSYLELVNLHPSFFADSWDDLRQHLVSCVIKAGSIDNASDVIGQKPWSCLKMLSLADNSITTLEQEPMQHVRSLTHLNLSSNLLIDVPAALASLYNLSSLNVSYNMISFTTGINTVLGNIQELDLRGNRLTLLAGLDRLWALERLDVRDNRIDDTGEIGRLTALPNIHDIWVEGNPFTKLNPDYRVEIFTSFRSNDQQIALDGTKPTFTERRRIHTTPDMSNDKVPAAIETPKWPNAAQEPPEEVLSEDNATTASSITKKKITRAKRKATKRVVKLGGGGASSNMMPEPEAAKQGDQQHVHRLQELEDSVQQELKSQRRAASLKSNRRRKPPVPAEPLPTTKETSAPSSPASDAFRRKIEAIRNETGTGWLRMAKKQPFLQTFTYDLALWLFNLMLNIFFREVRPRGAHKIPKDGPVIFVAAPHANQFIDPIVLMRECGRRVSFLIAEKSMHQKGIGFFARMISAIPVFRPQDLAKAGKGRLHLLNRKTDPLRITGIDTEFTKQLKKRDSIVLPKGAGVSEVVEIISDTELIIKKEFKELKAMEYLTATAGTAYKCMPHIEQDAVYKSVHDELNNGRCITIFPEGGSHDRAEMLPFKAGVTLMALGAMAKYEGLDVKIVPCGLNYFHAHRFRSRAVIEFGDPITVPAELVSKFKEGGIEKREACSTLLDTIYNALKTVTINAGSYETLMLIQAARRLYKPAHKKLHLSQVVDLNRRFLIGYNIFKDDPKVIDLQEKVKAYNQLLKYHGIRDHQVSKTDNNNTRLLLLLMKRLFVLTILLLWAFPGGILNLPVVIVAKVISQKKAKAALKSSTVKIAGRDVLATWKLLVGLVLIPTLYGFYSLITFIVVLQTDLDLKWKLLLPIAVWSLLPFVSYASLRFGEIGHDILRSIQPTVMALMDPSGAETLRQNREKLSSNITELINEYGPKVFTDFDANYISRTTEPSPIPSRTTSTGSLSWTSAPSKIPRIASGFFQQATRMNWLDDKNIFNWGRSSEDTSDDAFYFLDKFYGGRSRSNSISESDSRPVSRNRSRTNSFTNMSEGFKVEGMTSINNTSASGNHLEVPNKTKLRRIFRIDDVDEDEEEDEEDTKMGRLAVSENNISEDRKDV